MPRITVCTAYTTNYALGRLCEDVNRRYCERHGYRFISETLSAQHMQAAIDPRTCFSWYKVLMLSRLLEEEMLLGDSQEGYILWIDADAVFVRHDRTIESVIGLGPGVDLIVGEDLSAACQINAGVLLVRSSMWSHTLLKDMWARKSRFQRARYFEQSELLKQLSLRNEGLELVEPFHSYRRGPAVKRFPHVLVLPREEFNSNRGVILPTAHAAGAPTAKDDPELAASTGEQDVGATEEWRSEKERAGRVDDCRFIFHAVRQTLMQKTMCDVSRVAMRQIMIVACVLWQVGSWNKWPVVCAMLKVRTRPTGLASYV